MLNSDWLYSPPSGFPHTVLTTKKDVKNEEGKSLTAQFLFAANRWRPPACIDRPVLVSWSHSRSLCDAECSTSGEPSCGHCFDTVLIFFMTFFEYATETVVPHLNAHVQKMIETSSCVSLLVWGHEVVARVKLHQALNTDLLLMPADRVTFSK